MINDVAAVKKELLSMTYDGLWVQKVRLRRRWHPQREIAEVRRGGAIKMTLVKPGQQMMQLIAGQLINGIIVGPLRNHRAGGIVDERNHGRRELRAGRIHVGRCLPHLAPQRNPQWPSRLP